jgi:glycogen synthase
LAGAGCLDETPPILSGPVELRGVLDHASVIDLLRTASVVVLPSVEPDCCPTVVLEAMAVGRPVVTAASGGIVELVDYGVTGLHIAPGDRNALSKALLEVVTDPTRAEAIGRAALERARLFTASAVVGRIEPLYEGLVSGSAPAT